MLGNLKKQINKLESRKERMIEEGGAVRQDKLLQYFTKVATKALGAERCSIFVIDPDTDTVWLKAGTGLNSYAIEVPTEGSMVGEVIRSGETVRKSNMEEKDGAHQDTDAKTGFVTHNMLCVPIRDDREKKIVGAIQVLNRADGLDFDDKDEAALEEMAEHIQAHVYQVYLGQELYTLSDKIVNGSQKIVNVLLLLLTAAVIYAIFSTIF
ncbi:MAG: GAF domain-containing protein [Pseudomonadota bacterium]